MSLTPVYTVILLPRVTCTTSLPSSWIWTLSGLLEPMMTRVDPDWVTLAAGRTRSGRASTAGRTGLCRRAMADSFALRGRRPDRPLSDRRQPAALVPFFTQQPLLHLDQ